MTTTANSERDTGFTADDEHPSSETPADTGKHHDREKLSDRERQILRLLCDGLTNAQIATRMGVSSEVVKSSLKRIFRKIDVKNRTQAAVLVVHDRI